MNLSIRDNPRNISHLINEWIFCDTIYHSESDGSISWYSDYSFIDPFSKDIIEVPINNCGKYFYNTYNLWMQNVWCLLHDLNYDYTPKCPVCNNDLGFISVIKGFTKFCSRSCRANYYMTKNWESEDYRAKRLEICSEIMTNNWKNPEFRSKMVDITLRNLECGRSYEAKCLADRTNFILMDTYGKEYDLYLLYIYQSETDDFIGKIGISSQLGVRASNLHASYYHSLFHTEDKELIANLEYLIKINFKIGEYFEPNKDNWTKLKSSIRLAFKELNINGKSINNRRTSIPE